VSPEEAFDCFPRRRWTPLVSAYAHHHAMKPFHAKTRSVGPTVLLGVPLDHKLVFSSRLGAAPKLLRSSAKRCTPTPGQNTKRIDLGIPGIFEDAGDLPTMETADAFARSEDSIAKNREAGKRQVARRRSLPSLTNFRGIGKPIPLSP